MITVEVSYPGEGGFVNPTSDPVVGKSGRIWTILPLQIRLPFSLCHPIFAVVIGSFPWILGLGFGSS
ncbi:hypothetical protein RHMOL_Rhmol05G0277200 [Rhododendron molle]|uniref:Uncharacterized protein n=1 Tax=Rhododendron molle TaxID=49168 RepID=A0ACC0NV00_RHOML|nr:hypothetical protein RHMOL_Rhmol05G0277200 [Rhododendron molle]